MIEMESMNGYLNKIWKPVEESFSCSVQNSKIQRHETIHNSINDILKRFYCDLLDRTAECWQSVGYLNQMSFAFCNNFLYR
jgi:hypothetical protein